MESSITDWIGAGSSAATFVVALVAAVIGLRQLADARSVRREQSRPYVIVDFAFRGGLILLEIRNVGTTPASNIRMRFNPELESTQPDRLAALKASPALSDRIPMMAPNRSIQFYLDIAPSLFASDVQRKYSVRVSYSDLAPRRVWSWKQCRWSYERYEDPELLLDLDQYARMINQPKGLPDVVSEMASLNKTLNRWTDGTVGLRVHANNRDRMERAERLEAATYWFKKTLRKEGLRSAMRAYMNYMRN